MNKKTFSPEQYWGNLWQLEARSKEVSRDSLIGFERLSEKCMNLALKVPLLRGKNSGSYELGVAAIFLKRSMSDFRGAWLLLNLGYTYQAACVVASLYEHASVVNCISNREDLAREVVSGENGDIPWKPKMLAKMVAQKELYGNITKSPPKDIRFERAWKYDYVHYKLLCKMKHPTMQQLKDEAEMTMLDDGTFIMAAMPDTRNESLGTKHIILFIAIIKIISAINCFVQSIECIDAIEEDSIKKELADLYSGLQSEMISSKIGLSKIYVHGFEV